MVTGAPASGKSTLARELAAHYGLLCFAKDEFKEILFDTLGSADAHGSRLLSTASFGLLFALASRLLAAGHAVLLEGNFRVGEHEAAVRAALGRGERSGQPARLGQILCAAGMATRAARLAARAGEATRHPGHRDASQPIARAPEGFLDLPGWRLRFDSDASAAEQAAQLERLHQALSAWACEPCTREVRSP